MRPRLASVAVSGSRPASRRRCQGDRSDVRAALAARGDRPWQLRVAELGIAQVTAIIKEWEQMPGAQDD
jgi:hypothetical protein